MSYIVITGSPVNGHAFIGTFPTRDDAVAEARTWSDTDWWVVELEAPESVANVSEVSQEPGNATEPRRHDERCTAGPWLYAPGRCNCGAEADAEVAAALRVYRKVQACRRHDDGVCVSVDAANWYETAAGLLAWLKEGEA